MFATFECVCKCKCKTVHDGEKLSLTPPLPPPPSRLPLPPSTHPSLPSLPPSLSNNIGGMTPPIASPQNVVRTHTHARTHARRVEAVAVRLTAWCALLQ